MKIGIAVVHFGESSKLICPTSLERNNCFISDYEDFPNVSNTAKTSYIYAIIKNNNIKNDGFTKGNNLIIQQLFERDNYDWIWLLNNDTTVPDETFKSILDILPTLDKEIGIVGFQIRSLADPDFIHHAGTGICYPAGIHKTGSVKLGQHQKRTFEHWVTGASMLIRREVFEKIGLLDKNMKHIGSDSDFCYRARAAGYKVIYEPNFVIYHQIGTSQNPNPEIMKQMQADMLYFQCKWLNGKLFFDLEKELLV